MIRQVLLSAASIVAVTITVPAIAQNDRSAGDRLIIDNVNQPEATAGVRPNRGMSMETVESRWGAPAAKHGAVGDPPHAGNTRGSSCTLSTEASFTR